MTGLAVRGTELGLIPHPAAEPSRWVVLVEGPPDMISARSQGLPAIAVPGDDAWEPEWAQLLVGRHVSIVLDCDRAGRDAATDHLVEQAQGSLTTGTAPVDKQP